MGFQVAPTFVIVMKVCFQAKIVRSHAGNYRIVLMHLRSSLIISLQIQELDHTSALTVNLFNIIFSTSLRVPVDGNCQAESWHLGKWKAVNTG